MYFHQIEDVEFIYDSHGQTSFSTLYNVYSRKNPVKQFPMTIFINFSKFHFELNKFQFSVQSSVPCPRRFFHLLTAWPRAGAFKKILTERERVGNTLGGVFYESTGCNLVLFVRPRPPYPQADRDRTEIPPQRDPKAAPVSTFRVHSFLPPSLPPW